MGLQAFIYAISGNEQRYKKTLKTLGRSVSFDSKARVR